MSAVLPATATAPETVRRARPLGKNGELMLAAAVFILFELATLAIDIYTSLEEVAASRVAAGHQRLVIAPAAELPLAFDVFGTALGLLAFGFVVARLFTRLRDGESSVQKLRTMQTDMLATMREGMLVITPDARVGSQISPSVHSLFGYRLAAGDNFFSALAPLLSDGSLSDARDYVQMLLASHVKDALVEGMNPLAAVELAPRDADASPRFLAFHFHRSWQDAEIQHVVVSIQDVTRNVQLEQQLALERERSQAEFGTLLKAIHSDPALLRQFVARAESALLEVNDVLQASAARSSPPTPQTDAVLSRQLTQASRRVQAIYAEAISLGLDTMAAMVHSFDAEVMRAAALAGNALQNALPFLGMPLEDLLTRIASLKNLQGLKRPVADTAASAQAINEMLTGVAREAAHHAGKQVATVIRMDDHGELGEEAAPLVREIAVQLLRNAIAHGMETGEQRVAAGKPAEGSVQVELTRGETEWTLSVRDDGAGLASARIRQALVELDWYRAEQLDSFDERQIVAHIFKPGFTTTPGQGGRGTGLDLVQANVQRLGGRMQLASVPGEFTEFKVKFAA